MTRGLNPFHLLLAGLLLLVLDARRNGLDLFPNLLGFGLLVGAAFLLQESTAGPGERRLLQGALAASLVGLVASYPLLNVPGATTYVLPFLPWETRESAAAWGGYAALGIANGCLLLALRARVQSLGGNALFEGRARWGAVLSFGAPVAALLVEALAENPLIDFGAQGAVVTALGIVSALYAALVYFDARLLWGRPRQGPAQAPSDVRERRR